MVAQALMLSFVAGIGILDTRIFGMTLIERPLVIGTMVGIVLGDVTQGVIIGAQLELIWMGVSPVGASTPPDMVTGATLGTAFAIMAGQGPEIALALAVPIAILAQFLSVFVRIINVYFTNRADRYAEAGDIRGITRMLWTPPFLFFFSVAIPTFLAILVGAEHVATFVNSMPSIVLGGLSVGGRMLASLGLALLLKMLLTKNVAVFFFAGFLAASYLGLDITAVSLLGTCLAIIIYIVIPSQPEFGASKVAGERENFPAEEGARFEGKRKITNKELNSVFWRSLALQGAFNFERLQTLGFTYSMIPVIKKLYDKQEERIAALKRHLVLFSTTPPVAPIIMGVTAAMEERNANDPASFNAESINALKVSLMGPFAGIGDALFWGTLRIVSAGIGVSLAIDGNILGPIIFLVLFNIPNFLVRFFGLRQGYKAGVSSLERLQKSGFMAKVMSIATAVGLIVTGAMVANMVSIQTILYTNISGAEIVIQEILDTILPNMLPLAFTFFVFYLLQKKKISATYLTFGILVLGVALHALGVL